MKGGLTLAWTPWTSTCFCHPGDTSQFAIQETIFRKHWRLNRWFHRFAWNDWKTGPGKLRYQCAHQIVELQPIESFKSPDRYIPILWPNQKTCRSSEGLASANTLVYCPGRLCSWRCIVALRFGMVSLPLGKAFPCSSFLAHTNSAEKVAVGDREILYVEWQTFLLVRRQRQKTISRATFSKKQWYARTIWPLVQPIIEANVHILFRQHPFSQAHVWPREIHEGHLVSCKCGNLPANLG